MRVLCETMFENKKRDTKDIAPSLAKSKTFGEGLAVSKANPRKYSFLGAGGNEGAGAGAGAGGGGAGGLGGLGFELGVGLGRGKERRGREEERGWVREKMQYCDTFYKPLTVSEPPLSAKEVKFLSCFDSLSGISTQRIFSVLTDGEGGGKGKKKKEGGGGGGGSGGGERGWVNIGEKEVRDEEKIINFLKKKQGSVRERKEGEKERGGTKMKLGASLSVYSGAGPLIGVKGKKG